MQSFSQTQPLLVSTPSASTNQIRSTSLDALLLALPLMLMVGVMLHKRHRVNLRHRRVELLEKIWMLSPQEKTP